jgi:hypothetical protein
MVRECWQIDKCKVPRKLLFLFTSSPQTELISFPLARFSNMKNPLLIRADQSNSERVQPAASLVAIVGCFIFVAVRAMASALSWQAKAFNSTSYQPMEFNSTPVFLQRGG